MKKLNHFKIIKQKFDRQKPHRERTPAAVVGRMIVLHPGKPRKIVEFTHNRFPSEGDVSKEIGGMIERINHLKAIWRSEDDLSDAGRIECVCYADTFGRDRELNIEASRIWLDQDETNARWLNMNQIGTRMAIDPDREIPEQFRLFGTIVLMTGNERFMKQVDDLTREDFLRAELARLTGGRVRFTEWSPTGPITKAGVRVL